MATETIKECPEGWVGCEGNPCPRHIEYWASYKNQQPKPPEEIVTVESYRFDLLQWACDRWQAQVANRPLINIHRRSLDDTWRQVIRKLGGTPELLIGEDHDTLLAKATKS